MLLNELQKQAMAQRKRPCSAGIPHFVRLCENARTSFVNLKTD
jgi:hypothetical protein